MHIAHFLHRYPPAVGGAELYCQRLVQFHTHHTDTPTVWTSTALDLTALTGPGTELPAGPDTSTITRFRPLRFPLRRYILKAASLVPVPAWQTLTRPANPIMPRMWRAARRFTGPLDAVHALAFPHTFPAACGLRLARRRGVPFVLTPFLHLGDPTNPTDRTRRQYTAPPLAWLLRQADCVFTQTASEQAAVLKLGVPADRVVRQGLGVDLADCTGGNRHRARQNWGVTPDTVVVGHLANLSHEKGSVDLLHVASRLPSAAHLVLAGPAMPNFNAAWTAAPNLTRTGPLTADEKRDFFAGIDIFCLPSRVDSFGLVILEAWANGVPVVAYRAGGPADLVRTGQDGMLVTCGNQKELATMLIELIQNPTRREKLGATGAARVATGEFDWNESLAIVRRELLARIRPLS